MIDNVDAFMVELEKSLAELATALKEAQEFGDMVAELCKKDFINE